MRRESCQWDRQRIFEIANLILAFPFCALPVAKSSATPHAEPLVHQAGLPASRLVQSCSQASRAWQESRRKARPSPRDSLFLGRQEGVRAGELLPALRRVRQEAGP
jgi:hypothetical protein